MRAASTTRADADPSQLTDEDLGLANLILTNGARLYVDHAHPEYSSPEVTNPRDALVWGQGRERIMARAVELVLGIPGAQPVNLYKNNTDNKAGRVVRHPRELPHAAHDAVRRHRQAPHAVLRLAPGRHRLGPRRSRGRQAQARLPASQRADFFEVEVGSRPRSSARSSTRATSRTPTPRSTGRLHVIVGDANLAEISTYLKMGTTSLVLVDARGRRARPRPRHGRAR